MQFPPDPVPFIDRDKGNIAGLIWYLAQTLNPSTPPVPEAWTIAPNVVQPFSNPDQGNIFLAIAQLQEAVKNLQPAYQLLAELRGAQFDNTNDQGFNWINQDARALRVVTDVVIYNTDGLIMTGAAAQIWTQKLRSGRSIMNSDLNGIDGLQSIQALYGFASILNGNLNWDNAAGTTGTNVNSYAHPISYGPVGTNDLYFSLGTADAAPVTGDVKVFGYVLTPGF